MGIILSSNIDLQGGLPLDSRYGPYSSTTVANQSVISANRFVGLTVGISPDEDQIVSPRINSGLGILSFAANLLNTVSVLVAPRPSFLNR